MKRLLLFVCSFVLLSLLGEGLTRLLVSAPSPVLLRDGIYVSQLPLASGRDTVAWLGRGEHPPLAEKKRAGEIRIFVFGESSVQGSPWEYPGSPPTMLHDQLRARFPKKDLTIVNMGRGAAMTRDAYYFLVTIRRFSPDYVVFYMGGNDEYDSDAEMCMPQAQPRGHAAWRWLVEHSRLLWTIRALGPFYLVRLRHGPGAHGGSKNGDKGAPPEAACNPEAGFSAWTDVLVSLAEDMGARVVVTTAVENALRWREGRVEWASLRPLRMTDKDEAYRRILGCVLASDCDVPAAFRREKHMAVVEESQRLIACLKTGACNPFAVLLQAKERLGFYESQTVDSRRHAWLDTAARHGAEAIDFVAYVDQHVPGGPFPPFFAEERHLSLAGYFTLAWLWAEKLAPLIDGSSASKTPAITDGKPPHFNEEDYLPAVVANAHKDASCLMLGCAAVYLRANELIMASSLLNAAIGYDVPATRDIGSSRAGIMARLVRGSLRRAVGADPGLPKELSSLLERVRVEDVVRELQDHRDCSSVGTGLIDSLVAAGQAAPMSTATDHHENRRDDLHENGYGNGGQVNAKPGTSRRDDLIDGALGVLVVAALALLVRRRLHARLNRRGPAA